MKSLADRSEVRRMALAGVSRLKRCPSARSACTRPLNTGAAVRSTNAAKLPAVESASARCAAAALRARSIVSRRRLRISPVSIMESVAARPCGRCELFNHGSAAGDDNPGGGAVLVSGFNRTRVTSASRPEAGGRLHRAAFRPHESPSARQGAAASARPTSRPPASPRPRPPRPGSVPATPRCSDRCRGRDAATSRAPSRRPTDTPDTHAAATAVPDD